MDDVLFTPIESVETREIVGTDYAPILDKLDTTNSMLFSLCVITSILLGFCVVFSLLKR